LEPMWWHVEKLRWRSYLILLMLRRLWCDLCGHQLLLERPPRSLLR
jgi:hypothetical protein